jgi:hypothetical protein
VQIIKTSKLSGSKTKKSVAQATRLHNGWRAMVGAELSSETKSHWGTSALIIAIQHIDNQLRSFRCDINEVINSGELKSKVINGRRWIDYQSLKQLAGTS